MPSDNSESQDAGALGLLSSAFGGGGFPSITGGDAAPSAAFADSGRGGVIFSNPFSIAGQGGNASAVTEPTSTRGRSNQPNLFLIGLVALGIFFLGKNNG